MKLKAEAFCALTALLVLLAGCGDNGGIREADADVQVDEGPDIHADPDLSEDGSFDPDLPPDFTSEWDAADVPIPDGDASDSTEEPDAPALVFPGDDWEVAEPETQGVDSAGLDEALAFLEGVCGDAGVDQAVVIRNGYLIWQGDDIDNRHNVWSCTKSFTSTVMGLLVDDAACSTDTLAADFEADLSSLYASVQLRHFATMTSGYDAVGGDQSDTPFDPAAPIFAPGTEFLYWDSAMNQFANVLTRIAGEPIEDLFKRRVADPIGMDPDDWDWGDWGTIDGLLVSGGAGNKSRGIHITARQMARFGLLFLSRGSWDGTRVIGESWVDQATSVQVPTSIPPHEAGDRTGIYGFNWWVNGMLDSGLRRWPDGPAGTFMAVGFNGNYCVVIPEWRMVVVRLGVDGTAIASDDWSTFFRLLGESL